MGSLTTNTLPIRANTHKQPEITQTNPYQPNHPSKTPERSLKSHPCEGFFGPKCSWLSCLLEFCGSIWGQFGVNLGSNWGQIGVNLGSCLHVGVTKHSKTLARTATDHKPPEITQTSPYHPNHPSKTPESALKNSSRVRSFLGSFGL